MKPIGAPYANLSPVEVVRVRFWASLTSFAEARWLEANGWRRARDGWLLPDWHPHKRQADGTLGGLARFDGVTTSRPQIRKEPYTQSHAANSQRAHGDKGTVQRRNSPRHKAPPFPTYTLQPYAAMLVTAAFCMNVFALTSDTQPAHGVFVLASGLLICVSFCISYKARRAWELDWAESQLARKSPQ